MAGKASAETAQQLRDDLGLQQQDVKDVEYDVKKLQEFKQKTTADLKDKPSQAFVTETLSAFKETLRKTQQSLNVVDAKFEKVSSAQAGELQQLAASIDKCWEEVQVKLGKEEERKIYEQLKRCAEYTDFKALYKKVVPAIQGFEERMIEYDVEHKQTSVIVRRFDELLATRAAREDVITLRNDCAASYASRREQSDFMAKTEEDQVKAAEKLQEQLRQLEHVAS